MSSVLTGLVGYELNEINMVTSQLEEWECDQNITFTELRGVTSRGHEFVIRPVPSKNRNEGPEYAAHAPEPTAIIEGKAK
jgi:hypothetical protein